MKAVSIVFIYNDCNSSNFFNCKANQISHGTLSKPAQIVNSIMEECNMYNKGHILGIDNLYTDCNLIKMFVSKKTDLIGTIQKGRKGFTVRTYVGAEGHLRINQWARARR
jgi:hypothetical protein